MNVTAQNYVFNFDALILGCATILLCLIIQALFVMVVTSKFKSGVRQLVNSNRLVLAQSVFSAGILFLLISHLVQIYIWGLSLTLFDIIPNQHQAMVEIPSTDVAPGIIVAEMQAGYMIKDRLLRPALVGVAKAAE